MPGTESLSIHHLDIAWHETGNGNTLYFIAAGEDGVPAVYRIPTIGGEAELVVEGDLGVPTGLLALPGGDLVIAAVDDDGSGAIWRNGPAGLQRLATGIRLGTPTGMTLTPSDEELMISSLSESGTAQITLVDLDTCELSILDTNDVLGQSHSAGGLRRESFNNDDYYWYAWVDAAGDHVGTLSALMFL